MKISYVVPVKPNESIFDFWKAWLEIRLLGSFHLVVTVVGYVNVVNHNHLLSSLKLMVNSWRQLRLSSERLYGNYLVNKFGCYVGFFAYRPQSNWYWGCFWPHVSDGLGFPRFVKNTAEYLPHERFLIITFCGWNCLFSTPPKLEV